jgi:hypothetical protein
MRGYRAHPFFRMFFIICLFLVFNGCGYHISGGGENIDKSIQKVYVETFANSTSTANAENNFRTGFIDQFIRGGRFTLVDSKAAADAVLKGSIKGLTTTPLSRTTGSLAAEERLTVNLELVFEVTADKKPLWLNNDFSFSVDYLVDNNNASVTETRRREALSKLSNDTAERAYSMMMSGF